MPKQILTILFLCLFVKGNAQYFPAYDLQKDKHWLDSLKKVILKGDIPDSSEYLYTNFNRMKQYWHKQMPFLNSAVALGLYYERMYDLHHFRTMKTALYYSRKAVAMARFPDDEQAYIASAMRTNLFRKLADIYYKGKGIKKDRNLSLEYALGGFGYNKNFFRFYSERYFNCTCVSLNPYILKANNNQDTFDIQVNPFARKIFLFLDNDFKQQLKHIADIYKQQFAAKRKHIKISFYSYYSYSDQSLSFRFIEAIVTFWSGLNIPENIVTTDISNGYGNENWLRIIFE